MSQSSVALAKKPCSGRAFYNSRSLVACCSCSKVAPERNIDDLFATVNIKNRIKGILRLRYIKNMLMRTKNRVCARLTLETLITIRKQLGYLQP